MSLVLRELVVLDYFLRRNFRDEFGRVDDQRFTTGKRGSQLDIGPTDRIGIDELADLHARFVSDPVFSFLIVAGQQNEMNLAAVIFGRGDQLPKVFIVRSELIAESVNETDAFSHSFGDDDIADIADNAPERRRAEFNDRLHAIYAQVIVKHLYPGALGDRICDRQLSCGRWSVNDYQFHTVSSSCQYHLR